MKALLSKHTTPSKIFLFSILGFVFGVFLGPFFIFGYRLWGVFSLFVLSLAIIFWENRLFRAFCLFLLFLILGIFRYNLALPKNNPSFIHFYNGQTLEIEGQVISFPVEELGKESFEAGFLKIKDKEGNKKPVLGKIFVEKFLYPEVSYGDRIFLKGKLQSPLNKENFAQKDYLTSKYIFSYLEFPQIEILEKKKGNKFWEMIFILREKIRNNFWSFLPPKEASLLSALVLGMKKEMPSFFYDLFKNTGTAHLIVVSGFHLIILAEMLLRLLGPYLGRRALFLVIFFGLVFVLLTGANPPAVRAFIFILLLHLAEIFGRKKYLPTTFALAAFLLLFHNPFLLRFSLSFQLSFLATLGITTLSKFFEKIFHQLPQIFSVPLSTTLSAQIFVLPYMLFKFSNFSFVSFLANILVVFPAQILLIFGFIVGFLGLILPFLNKILILAMPLLNFIFAILEILSKFPVLNFSNFHGVFYFTIFYYLFLIIFLFYQNKIFKNENE